ncbi:protein TOPAZ1 isoform X3 [Engystomops pustulosus]|uniref:protein TOPAZ1 isoform X3 n=1 Tax=Engystomops pustulosus TaxID=76066 RepID=UPI003AFAB5B6
MWREHLKSNVKDLHLEPLNGEERRSSAERTCVQTKPSIPSRSNAANRVSNVKKRKIPVTAGLNTDCSMTVSEQSTLLQLEENAVTSEMSENNVAKCSTKTCHIHSPGLPNPVVRLQNCRSLYHLRSSSKEQVVLPSSSVQNQISPTAPSSNASISRIEDINNNEKMIGTTSIVNNQNNTKSFLKVKFSFRKKEQNHSSQCEERNIELTSIDSIGKDLNRESLQNRSNGLTRLKLSRSQNGTSKSELDNVNGISAGQNSLNETSTSLWSSWRTKTLFMSDEEISDHDFDKPSTISVCSSNLPQTKEGDTGTCQRVVPYTPKTIWKCSCARTYVLSIPQKKLAAVRNTIIFGIEAERSMEIYSNDKDSLLESVEGRMNENDGEPVCKKEKLSLRIGNAASPNSSSCESTLDASLSAKSKGVTETGASDTSFSVPSASEPSRKNIVECSKYCGPNDEFNASYLSSCDLMVDESLSSEKPSDTQALVDTCDTCLSIPQTQEPCIESKIPNNEFQLESKDKAHSIPKSPSRMEICIDQEPITNALPFKIPDDETVILLHGGIVCDLKKDLQNEVCPTSTSLEEVNDHRLSSHIHSGSEDIHFNFSSSERIDEEVKDKEVLETELLSSSTENLVVDLVKAYKEDVLVIDVIQDDPELFDFSTKEGGLSSIKYCKANSHVQPHKMLLISEVHRKVVPPVYESKPCVKRIEYVSDPENDFFDVAYQQDASTSCTETNKITFSKLEERGPIEKQDKDSPQESHHARSVEESKSSPAIQEALTSKPLPTPLQSLFHHPESSLISNSPTPWKNDVNCNRKDISPPEVAASDMRLKWKNEKASPRIQQTWLPNGYCRYHFNTFNGCTSRHCPFLHIPKMCDEKVCMEVLHKLINENNTVLLNRAAWIFSRFYSQYPPRLHYDRGIFCALLNSLINRGLWQEVFLVLESAAASKIFPPLEHIIKIFEGVAFSGLQTAFSTLVGIFCKLVHGGMSVTPAEIGHIIAIMSKCNAAQNHIGILFSMKSRLERKISKSNWAYDVDAALSEVEHCKVNSDWMKLGTLYVTVCTGCENLTMIKNFSRCVAEALMKDSINERPEIPYCELADAVFKNPQFNDMQKNLLGRIGISIMCFYHLKELWLKGRKVIYKFHELKINYTILKGLFDQESVASRCHVVNIAVEIFLKSGNLGGAVQILKESDWIISTPMWPCNMMDVLHRHNLMCLLVQEALSKNMLTLCFEILQNLPGFQESQADFNVSQYAMLFNKVLTTCVANRSIGMSSSIIDFMIAKKIAIDYANLRGFITTLGQSGLWTKARGYYKSALTLGYYPLFEGKHIPKILYIPSFMSEVEMLMTIEHFMVSNASSIQSQVGCNQSLQIVLKRMEEDSGKYKDLYHAAADRLFEAGRLSTPRLFIKHLTVNNINEQVYTLDNNSSLKWLNENIKWAGNVWCDH